jgi:hypothetical protein
MVLYFSRERIVLQNNINMVQYSTDRLSGRKAGLPDRPAVPLYSGLTITGNSKMKTIQLTQGKVALVDDEDFEWLSQWKWHLNKKGNSKEYATRKERKTRRTIAMHRFILRLVWGDGIEGDHKDGNGLNNCKNNLRKCTSLQNHYNMKKINKICSSKYKGVSWNKKRKHWESGIRPITNKRLFLGYFDTEIGAAMAYDAKAKELFGEFACLNFPTVCVDACKARYRYV